MDFMRETLGEHTRDLFENLRELIRIFLFEKLLRSPAYAHSSKQIFIVCYNFTFYKGNHNKEEKKGNRMVVFCND